MAFPLSCNLITTQVIFFMNITPIHRLRRNYQAICEVRVLRRAHGFHEEFDDVEMRIGNVDKTGSGMTQFTDNQWVGYSTPFVSDLNYVLAVEPAVEGRYLTFQIMVDQVLGIDEVYAKALI